MASLGKVWSARRGVYVYEIRYRIDGKSRRRTLGTSDPAKAKAALAAFRVKEGSAAPIGPAMDALALVERFCQEAEVGLSAATVRFYRGTLRRVVSAFQGRPVAAWTPQHFAAWVKAQTWRPRSTQIHLAAARRWIAWAHRRGYAAFPDFVAGMKAPPVHKEAVAHLTLPQVAALIEAARGSAVELVVPLAALAGMRRNEMARATWGDVDWHGGGLTVHGTKTHADRLVPLSDALRAALAPHRGESSQPILPEQGERNRTRSLAAACARAGVPVVGLHALRHSFATALAAAGVDVATIGALLGHARGSPITLRYLHPDADRMRAAVARITGQAPVARLRLVP